MQTKLLEEEGRMRSLTSSASRPSSSFGSNQRLGQCLGFQLFLESLSILSFSLLLLLSASLSSSAGRGMNAFGCWWPHSDCGEWQAASEAGPLLLYTGVEASEAGPLVVKPTSCVHNSDAHWCISKAH